MIPARLLSPGDVVRTAEGEEALILGFNYINNGQVEVRDSVDLLIIETGDLKTEYLFSAILEVVRKAGEQGSAGSVLDTLL